MDRIARPRTLDDRSSPDPNDPVIAHLIHHEGKTRSEATRIRAVQRRKGPVVTAVRAALGSRLADVRLDDERGLLLYVLDPTDADRDTAAEIARRGGIEGMVRVEIFRPEWIAVWDELRADLARLHERSPDVLLTWPGEDTRYRRPPHQIHLTGLGESIAADWHQRFGADVELRVGARPYPPADVPEKPIRCQLVGETIDLDEFHAELDGELSIASGTSTSHGLLLTNRTGPAVELHSNGSLKASVVDLGTGEVVGVASGPSFTPQRRTRIAAGARVRIPVRVGTDSVDPALGYAVPPGQWGLVVHIRLSDGRQLNTPPLPITISPTSSRVRS